MTFEWLEALREDCEMTISEIPFRESCEWNIDEQEIVHKTGGFFSIVGLQASSSIPDGRGWEQPIINQPEVGILGFLVTTTGDENHFLVQGKAEPGNIGLVQFAPTVQATFSNYTRKHGGDETAYLEHFTETEANETLLSDSLQSEQGTRFFRKFNRNVVVKIPYPMPLHGKYFSWLSAEAIREALHMNYVVNTDARSVLVCAPWELLSATKQPFDNSKARQTFGGLAAVSYKTKSERDIVDRAQRMLRRLRDQIALDVELCGLRNLAGWSVGDSTIKGANGNGALVVKHYRVHAPEREKTDWDQPLVSSTDEDEILLIAQVRRGVLRFLLMPSVEVGLTGGVELGPSYKRESHVCSMEYPEIISDSKRFREIVTVRQSDEGGRFMRACSTYKVVEVPEEVDLNTGCHDEGLWVTLCELEALCREPGLLTNEARSVVSLLLGLA